jgi:hypothetical protein
MLLSTRARRNAAGGDYWSATVSRSTAEQLQIMTSSLIPPQAESNSFTVDGPALKVSHWSFQDMGRIARQTRDAVLRRSSEGETTTIILVDNG